MIPLNNVVFLSIILIGAITIAFGIVYKRRLALFLAIGWFLLGVGIGGFIYPRLVENTYSNMDNNPAIKSLK